MWLLRKSCKITLKNCLKSLRKSCKIAYLKFFLEKSCKIAYLKFFFGNSKSLPSEVRLPRGRFPRGFAVLYVSLAQIDPELWLDTKTQWFLSFPILKGKFVKSYKIQKIKETIFSRLLMYLWIYLSYRDVQYLILKLETNYFDLFLFKNILRALKIK